jgi:hypothetical protein
MFARIATATSDLTATQLSANNLDTTLPDSQSSITDKDRVNIIIAMNVDIACKKKASLKEQDRIQKSEDTQRQSELAGLYSLS